MIMAHKLASLRQLSVKYWVGNFTDIYNHSENPIIFYVFHTFNKGRFYEKGLFTW